MTENRDPRYLEIISPDEATARTRRPIDPEILDQTRSLVRTVDDEGDEALHDFAVQYDGRQSGDPLWLGPASLKDAWTAMESDQQETLSATADRIGDFARAQRECLIDLATSVPGGRAGHEVHALDRAACYAPGGEYPLPSSVLMTAVPAHVAGVDEVYVASPDPHPVTLAAAYAADADGVLPLGGAHAIAAFAFGTESVPRCDIVTGPGGPWVTAGKQLVSGFVRTDLMAGPTELLVFATADADPSVIASDLLAQAEHAPDALPVLVTTATDVVRQTDAAIERQLAELPTADIARQALESSYAVIVETPADGVDIVNELAPEHVLVCGDGAIECADALEKYGTLFIGQQSAEAFGDYGVGPNHVLPTGGAARFTGGLSVFDFLKLPTWIKMNDAPLPDELRRDIPRLARMEGLEGHARSAERRFE